MIEFRVAFEYFVARTFKIYILILKFWKKNNFDHSYYFVTEYMSKK